MNEQLQKKLSSLENMISIQKDCVVSGYPETAYMHGMLNGMICAHSVFDESPPEYYKKPRRSRPPHGIRHKCVRKPKLKSV